MLVCNKCKNKKSTQDFDKRKDSKNGYRAECKACRSIDSKKRYAMNRERIIEKAKNYAILNAADVKIRQKNYREKNKLSAREYNKEYREKNRKSLLEYSSDYYSKNRNEILAKQRDWAYANKDIIRDKARRSYLKNRENRIAETVEYKKRKRRSGDPVFKAAELARGMLRRVVDATKQKKESKSFELLGFSPYDLANRIEKQFEDGMTWGNHGEWHIDHIVPVATLIKEGVHDPKVINSLENLRPLWKTDNLRRRFEAEDRQTKKLKDSLLNLNKNFRPATLDEMRRMEPTAFDQAGLD